MFNNGFMNPNGYGFGQYRQRSFDETFKAFPMSFLDGKSSAEKGDKIVLPQSAFERLAQMEVQYPMQFTIANDAFDPPRVTHVGVLEFTAQEGALFFFSFFIARNSLANPAPASCTFYLQYNRYVLRPVLDSSEFSAGRGRLSQRENRRASFGDVRQVSSPHERLSRHIQSESRVGEHFARLLMSDARRPNLLALQRAQLLFGRR